MSVRLCLLQSWPRAYNKVLRAGNLAASCRSDNLLLLRFAANEPNLVIDHPIARRPYEYHC
jgi:hypothetical protein